MARHTSTLPSVEETFGPEDDGTQERSLADLQADALEVHDDAMAELVVDTSDLDLEAIPTVAMRQKEAKMAVHKSTRDLMDHDLILIRWREQDALLENTGEIHTGYFVVGVDLTTKDVFSVFFGGVALLRTLRNVKPPMRCRIVKHGRTLVFE